MTGQDRAPFGTRFQSRRTCMLSRPFAGLVPLILAATTLLPSSTQAETEGAKKYALLVGVNDYDHADLSKLSYAVNDVAELRQFLVWANYEVVLLTADEARAKKDRSRIP